MNRELNKKIFMKLIRCLIPSNTTSYSIYTYTHKYESNYKCVQAQTLISYLQSMGKEHNKILDV